MRTVPVEDWDLASLKDDSRKSLLLSSISPHKLIEMIADEGIRAAIQKTVHLRLVEATCSPGYWRAEAKFQLSTDTFDLFFNGRMGYRAQYYLSVKEGRCFNRLVVDKLTLAFGQGSTAAACGIASQWSQIEASLNAEHSKIWIAGDWAAFCGEPHVLRPDNWVQSWNASNDKPIGLAAPCPNPANIELKGSFVDVQKRRIFLPKNKRDRDEKIHRFGWT